MTSVAKVKVIPYSADSQTSFLLLTILLDSAPLPPPMVSLCKLGKVPFLPERVAPRQGAWFVEHCLTVSSPHNSLFSK